MSSTEYKSYFQYTRHFFQPFHSVIPLRKYGITISLMGYSIMDRVKSVEEKQTQPMEWAHVFKDISDLQTGFKIRILPV